MLLLRAITRKFPLKPSIRTVSSDENIDKSKNLKDMLDNSATFEDLHTETAETEWATLPYPEGTSLRRDQSKKAFRPKVDPKETSIILFPGQGAQYVGMAQNLIKFPDARDLFEIASDVLR